MASLKLASGFFAFLVAVAVLPREADSAITCGDVSKNLIPCIGYLQKGGAIPPKCCDGVRALDAAAKTTADRQVACGCLKSTASSVGSINFANAQQLPAKCNVKIPYPISPSTDCSKVK